MHPAPETTTTAAAPAAPASGTSGSPRAPAFTAPRATRSTRGASGSRPPAGSKLRPASFSTPPWKRARSLRALSSFPAARARSVLPSVRQRDAALRGSLESVRVKSQRSSGRTNSKLGSDGSWSDGEERSRRGRRAGRSPCPCRRRAGPPGAAPRCRRRVEGGQDAPRAPRRRRSFRDASSEAVTDPSQKNTSLTSAGSWPSARRARARGAFVVRSDSVSARSPARPSARSGTGAPSRRREPLWTAGRQWREPCSMKGEDPCIEK